MLNLLSTPVIKFIMLIPLKTCVRVNDYLSKDLAGPLSDLTGAVGGVLMALAALITIIAAFVAIPLSVTKKAREAIIAVLRPYAIVILLVLAIGLCTILINLLNNTLCG
jgi:hypothetical protein